MNIRKRQILKWSPIFLVGVPLATVVSCGPFSNTKMDDNDLKITIDKFNDQTTKIKDILPSRISKKNVTAETLGINAISSTPNIKINYGILAVNNEEGRILVEIIVSKNDKSLNKIIKIDGYRTQAEQDQIDVDEIEI